MAAFAQTPFGHDLPRGWYARQMARTFGEVCFDHKHNATYWYINVNLDGKRHRLRGYRTLKGRLLRFPDEAAAKLALEEIRSDIRHGVDPIQAISEFLPLGAPQTLFERHYVDFCKARASDRSVPLSR